MLIMNLISLYSIPDNLTLRDQLTIGDRWSVRGFLMIVEEFIW